MKSLTSVAWGYFFTLRLLERRYHSKRIRNLLIPRCCKQQHWFQEELGFYPEQTLSGIDPIINRGAKKKQKNKQAHKQTNKQKTAQ